jgi:hypothetical protein
MYQFVNEHELCHQVMGDIDIHFVQCEGGRILFIRQAHQGLRLAGRPVGGNMLVISVAYGFAGIRDLDVQTPIDANRR